MWEKIPCQQNVENFHTIWMEFFVGVKILLDLLRKDEGVKVMLEKLECNNPYAHTAKHIER